MRTPRTHSDHMVRTPSAADAVTLFSRFASLPRPARMALSASAAAAIGASLIVSSCSRTSLAGGDDPVALGVGAVPGRPGYENVVRGVELAVERLNEKGKVKFRVRLPDAGSTSAVRVAQGLRDDPAVIGVVGHPESGHSIEALPVYSDGEHGGANAVVMVSPTASSPRLSGHQPLVLPRRPQRQRRRQVRRALDPRLPGQPPRRADLSQRFVRPRLVQHLRDRIPCGRRYGGVPRSISHRHHGMGGLRAAPGQAQAGRAALSGRRGRRRRAASRAATRQRERGVRGRRRHRGDGGGTGGAGRTFRRVLQAGACDVGRRARASSIATRRASRPIPTCSPRCRTTRRWRSAPRSSRVHARVLPYAMRSSASAPARRRSTARVDRIAFRANHDAASRTVVVTRIGDEP